MKSKGCLEGKKKKKGNKTDTTMREGAGSQSVPTNTGEKGKTTTPQSYTKPRDQNKHQKEGLNQYLRGGCGQTKARTGGGLSPARGVNMSPHTNGLRSAKSMAFQE